MNNRLAVFISGNGSNLQAMIDACKTGSLCADIVLVFSDREDAYGLTRAKQAGIPTVVLSGKNYSDRQTYDQAVLETIQAYQPDWIALAGYMRIVSEPLLSAYAERILNIHPALLPKYRGLNTYKKALAAGDKEHGTTVHLVTAELDGGPILAQQRLPILAEDTEESLKKRTQALEHELYPKVIDACCRGLMTTRHHQQ